MENWWLRWDSLARETPAIRESQHEYRKGYLTIGAPHQLQNIAIAEEASRCLVLIGEFSVKVRDLEAILKDEPNPRIVVDKAHSLSGSFHIIYADNEENTLIVQAPASGARETFYALSRAAQRLWVASTPLPIARQVEGKPNLSMLAMSLMYPGLDYGIATHTFWTNVTRLSANKRLVAKHGDIREEVWWNPRLDFLSIDEGAEALAEALQTAIACRGNGNNRTSADLSGGMDSTSICLLLSAAGKNFRSYVEKTEDPNHDDYVWASDAAQAMGRPLTILDQRHLPGAYDGIVNSAGELIWDAEPELNAPYTLIRNRARKAAYADLLASGGKQVLHYSGFGADELFTVAPAFAVDLYKQNTLRGIRAAKKLRFLRRWRSTEVWKILRRSGNYQEWLAREIPLIGTTFDPQVPSLEWGPQLRLPPWASEQTVESVQEHLHSALPNARPQHDTRSLHIAIAGQRIGGIRLAPLTRLFAARGVQLTMPYMDDAVLEASLRVRRAESPPGEAYKPLLVKAMRDVQNNPVLGRSTKGEFSKTVELGLLRNKEGLSRLFKESRLEQAGLIDTRKLMKSLNNPFRPQHETGAFELTIAAEVWLREIEMHSNLLSSDK